MDPFDQTGSDPNGKMARPHVPPSSLATGVTDENGKPIRTNKGNTQFIMALLSEMWLFNIFFILGGTFLMTFYLPQFYIDYEIWNVTCYWKLGMVFFIFIFRE